MILPLRQLNYLKEFWFDPCDAPFTVYARAFFPAALQALITWYTPDLTNILFNATRPVKALNKRRSGRKGVGGSKSGRPPRGRRVFNPLAFDQDEFIGKKIGATTNFQNRSIGGLEWRLWQIYGILERIGLWVLVINLVADFFYQWMSLAEKSEYCQAQRSYIVVRRRPLMFQFHTTGWLEMTAPIVEKQRGLISGTSSVQVPAGMWLNVSAGGTARPTSDRPIRYDIRIIDSENNVFAQEGTSGSPNQSVETAVNAKIRGPRIIRIQHRVDWLAESEGSWTAFGTPSPIR